MINMYRHFYVYNDKNKHIKMCDKIFFGKSYSGKNKYLTHKTENDQNLGFISFLSPKCSFLQKVTLFGKNSSFSESFKV